MLSSIIPIAFLLAGQPAADFVPAMAVQHTETTKPAAPQSETDKLFDTYFEQFYARKYAEALATTSKFDADELSNEGLAVIKAMRGAALVGLKRDKEAIKLFAEADIAAPSMVLVSTLQYEAGLYADNFALSAEALDRMIARMPDAVRDLSVDGVHYFLRNEPGGQERRNEDRRVALARLGFGGSSAAGDYFTAGAVNILMKRGDLAGATELLPHIDEPQLIENLLIQRRFSSLWPTLEAQAGPHLEKVRASAVASAERDYASAPESAEKLQQFINALRLSGRHDRAIALRAKLPTTAQGMSSAEEDIGWAVNNVALALHEAGRADEADKLFALLNDAPMENDDWRVSMKINRLELLVADGKYDRALPLVEPTAKVPGSPYAQQLVRRLRYCTLSGLGRKDESAKLLPDLLAHAKDAPGPTIDGLICAGEFEQAEKVALAALKDDSFHEDFIRQLQAHPLTSDDPSVWAKGWQLLRKRPAIAAEFDRLGRDMPAEFLPASPELTGKPDPAGAEQGWTAEG